ncbi:glycosyltransferase [Lactiplantibacillus pentosus]|uniref:glycosyltransferase n=1 Tax=Lactiplantibacillus pentosus TaxID=1589 RepID=UPI001C1EC96E|nr:glycosyltransferase [Lactiplantibacillus pentosus]MBU7511248.1 glycosyltransferase [Lactiplantibacillus pentosus]MBU7517642.1 glycosyltransferase [Lactiplantibacillus pentosus]
MTKIVHVLFSSKLGGAEQVAINISKNLSGSYNFVYVSPSGLIQESLKTLGIQYQSFTPKKICEFKHKIEALKPDIIHAHDFKASFLVNLLFNNIPIITHIHQAPKWQTSYNWKSIAFQYIAKKSSQIIYVSDWAKESYVFQDKLKNVSVIPNGIDTLHVIKMSKVKTSTVFDLLFVGRLEAVKDPERFVRIVKRLLKKIPELKVGIIGDGTLKERISEQIEDIAQIELLGFSSNPYKYMVNAKVVLSTSKSDAFGLTMVEAALLGAIPFAPSIGGIAQTTSKVNGIVYSSDDELVELLSRVFSDVVFYKKTTSEMSKVEMNYYDQGRFIEQIRQEYEGVLNNGRNR